MVVDGRGTPGCSAEYEGLLSILPEPPPGEAHPLSRLLFVSAMKQAQYGLFALVDFCCISWYAVKVGCENTQKMDRCGGTVRADEI